MEWTIPWTFHGPVHVDSIWIPWNFQIPIPWTIPYGFHGPFKFNVIPLLYIYISEKKCIMQGLNPGGPWHVQTHAVAN